MAFWRSDRACEGLKGHAGMESRIGLKDHAGVETHIGSKDHGGVEPRIGHKVHTGTRIPVGWRDRLWLPGVLAGILFLGIGALEGQLDVVWKKAVMICMECIGIG